MLQSLTMRTRVPVLLNHKFVTCRGTAKLAARPTIRSNGSDKAMRHRYPSERIAHVVAMPRFPRVFPGLSVQSPIFIENQDVTHSAKKVPRGDGSGAGALMPKRQRGLAVHSKGIAHPIEEQIETQKHAAGRRKGRPKAGAKGQRGEAHYPNRGQGLWGTIRQCTCSRNMA